MNKILIILVLILFPWVAEASFPGTSTLIVDPRNYGAVCDGTVWSASTGRPVQQGTDDDTTGFQNAQTVAQAIGAIVVVPDGCWVQNMTLISGVTLRGMTGASNDGFDRGTNGQPLARPVLYIIGHPSFGINLNTAETVALESFQVSGASDASAFGVTSCVGSSQGSAGFGGKVYARNMSFFGCAYGIRPSGGLVYLVSEDNNYGGNNVGIGGSFSDFYSLQDTWNSGAVAIDMTQGSGGFSRISGGRIEYMDQGFLLSNSGIETDIVNTQFDHMGSCALNLSGRWNDITMTGGALKAGGTKGSLTVTGAADNGSGLIRLTVNGAYSSFFGQTVTSGLSTGDVITVTGVTGTTEANGTWTLTVVDSTHIDLQSSTFANAYISGGYGGVNNKDSDICLSGSSGAQGLHLVNVGYYSSSSLGQAAAPAYIIDAKTSGANNDFIELVGGVLNKIGTVVVNFNSYTIDIAKWQNGAAPNYRVWVNGAPPIMTDNTVFSINSSGGVALGSNNAQAGMGLDMTAQTGAVGLPTWTTAQRPATPITGMMGYNSSNGNPEAYYAGKWNAFNSSPVIPFYIGGLTLSNDIGTPNTTVDISTGGAADDANTTVMVLSSPINKTTGSWTVGNNNGCLDTGTVANSTWYHVFLIFRSDTGVTDILCSTSATTPTLPTNYTNKRRIGSIKTDGSAHILSFVQVGSVFWWGTPTLDINTSTLGTTAALETLNVPTGVKTSPICRYSISSSGTNSVILTSSDETDIAPTNALPISAAPGEDMIDQQQPFGATNTSCPILTTNTSQQIRARATAASTTLSIVTRGWID